MRTMHSVFPEPVLWSHNKRETGEAGCTSDATTFCCGSSWTFPCVGEDHCIDLSTSRACWLKPWQPGRSCWLHMCEGYPSSGTCGSRRALFFFLAESCISSSSSLSGSSGSKAPSSVSQHWSHAVTSLDVRSSQNTVMALLCSWAGQLQYFHLY